MKKYVVFLEVEDVEWLHDQLIEEFGGATGLFPHHSVEASIKAMEQTWEGKPLYNTIADVAAGYAFSLITSHPFVDGNKRTALGAAFMFLDWNGYDPGEFSDWQDDMVKVARHEMSREQLAKKFAKQMGEWGEFS